MSTESETEDLNDDLTYQDISEGSFSVGKFLGPPQTVGNEQSLFFSWLQNRLREHYLKLDEHQRQAREHGNYEPILQIDESEICFHELKLIDIHEDTNIELHPANVDCIVKDIQLNCDQKDLYETATRRITVTFQRNGVTSPVETLHILMEIGEVLDVGLFEKLTQPFIAYSEKHAINVFRHVFPAFEGWLYVRKGEIKLPIPTAYYSRCEEDKKMDLARLMEEEEVVENNILSKIAAVLKKNRDNDDTIESHRLIIVEDLVKEGFGRKNSTGTSFLPLMNVMAGLKEIAKLHAVSWSFSKSTDKQLFEHWPFLEMKNFLPFINERVAIGFPVLATLAEEYLIKYKAEDKDRILQRLQFISKNISTVMPKLFPPNAVLTSWERNPVTLVHQNLNYMTTLFRHTTYKANQVEAKEIELNSIESNPKVEGYMGSNLLIYRELRIDNWKFATYGSPMVDVASFLLTSLPPKMRREETALLLKLYSEEFQGTCTLLGQSQNISWKWGDLAEDFERGLLYAALLISATVTPTTFVPEDDMEVFVEVMRDVVALNIA